MTAGGCAAVPSAVSAVFDESDEASVFDASAAPAVAGAGAACGCVGGEPGARAAAAPARAGSIAAAHDALFIGCDCAGVSAVSRAPICMPSRNSSTPSSSALPSAIVTIREVIENTYCMAHHHQGTIVVTCAGATTWITPPHVHISFEAFCSAGMPPIITVGKPGTHGAAVTGTH